MKLTDKVVVLTGGGTGLGQSTCIRFAKEGADIVVCYHSSKAGAEETVRLIEAEGRRAIAVQCDVGNEESLKNLIRTAYDTFGRIDVLVNNSVVRYINGLDDIDDEGWDRSMNTNVRSCYIAAREVFPIMKAQGGGTIINVASMHGVRPSCKTRLLYSTSKAAMIALTRAQAAEMSPYNIFVNAIVLGSYPTPGAFQNHLADMEDPSDRQKAIELYEAEDRPVPARRKGRMEESDECMLFLANANNEFTTGSVMVADGGWTIID